MLYSIMLVV